VTPAAQSPLGRTPRWLAAALLVAVALLAYSPVAQSGFVWDDDVALTRNPLVQAADGLYRAWFTTQAPDYWPVTLTTFWVEWRIWGANPLGYHLVNLALHVGEVLLLWRVLRRLRIPGAWLGALLFAVHPVNVESVAWVTQRKNLMAMLFYLASVWAFLRAGWPEEKTKSGRWYAASLAAFVLAMLSKGSVAILPLVLVGIVAWRRRLALRDALWAAPFFLVAAALTAVNIWFQAHHLAGADLIRQATFLQRLLGAGAALGFYLSKAVLPLNLTFFYPLWRIDAHQILWYLPLLAALGLTVWLWRRSRAALFAWLYFCAALVPVLGFTDVYFMKFSLVADHYQHLALIGVTALAGYGFSRWRARNPRADAFAAALVASLAFLACRQCLAYASAETLARETIRRNPDAWLAHDNLGVILGQDERRLPEAEAEFREAIRLKPDWPEAHSNLGVMLVREQRLDEGIAQYEEALRLQPADFVANLNLGSLLLFRHRYDEARRCLAAAAGFKPGFAPAHFLLGQALARLGRTSEAEREFEAFLRLKPGDASGEAALAQLRAQP
jgi:tetratricopeptide (TPR) repeat protein